MLGIAIIPSGDIFIVGDELFKTVVLHEVGHVLLGSWHSSCEKELMYPEVGEEKSISEREALFVQLFTR
jgi:predicted Zn-dependent protease